jgi:hypothetical protein
MSWWSHVVGWLFALAMLVVLGLILVELAP